MTRYPQGVNLLKTLVEVIGMKTLDFVRNRRFFIVLHPLSGGRGVRNEKTIQESLYYWWWYAMTLNDDYLKCCANGGKGKLSTLYEAFGDVRYQGDKSNAFWNWWSAKVGTYNDGEKLKRGEYLFAEPAFEKAMKVITDVNNCEAVIDDANQILVSVPLTITREAILRMFKRHLNNAHTGVAGKAARSVANSQALYTPVSTPQVRRVKEMFDAYDMIEKSKRDGKRLNNWKVAKEVGIQVAIKERPNEPTNIYDQRQADAEKVSKLLSQAKATIANVANGVFP